MRAEYSILIPLTLIAAVAILSGCASTPVGHEPNINDLAGLADRNATVALLPPAIVVDGAGADRLSPAERQIAVEDTLQSLANALTANGYKVVNYTPSAAAADETNLLSTAILDTKADLALVPRVRIIPIGERYMTEISLRAFNSMGAEARQINWVIEPSPITLGETKIK